MQLKVELNFKAFAKMDIVLPNKVIKSGEVFELVDAYKEGQSHVFIGIQTEDGIQEAGFKIPKTKQVGNERQLKSFLDLFIIPYFEGTKYVILKTKS